MPVKSKHGLQYKGIPLNGRWIPSSDGTETGEGDFQVLSNMRYGTVAPQSIGGMTKINTTALSNPKVRSGIHFKKDTPSESHVLVQAWNSGETSSVVYDNTTAIPDAGDFSATAKWTDATGSSYGKFSNAPDGCVAYCNGKESLVWGGNEYRCGGFINIDPAGSFSYDYTDKVSNSLSDSENTAYLKSTSGGIDANTVLLLHCEGADASTTFTDSSASARTVTTVGNAQIDDAQKKFGSTSGLFDGNGDYLTVPSHADFDFSSGTWSIDFWYRTDRSKNNYIFSVGKSATTYFHFYSNTDGAFYLEALQTIDRPYRTNTTAYSANDFIRPTIDNDYIYECTTAGTSGGSEPTWSTTVNGTTNDGTVVWTTRSIIPAADANLLYTPTDSITANTWTHVELSQNGDNWYIFVNGVQRTYKHDIRRLLPSTSYTTIINICEDFQHNAALSTKGWLDEFRISKIARHTSNFTVATAAYAAGSDVYIYIGSTMPIQGAKFYVNTPNTSASTASVSLWNSVGWADCTNVSDGTSVGGVSLAQTGSITFDSTVNTAKPHLINGAMGYWYRFKFTSLDSNTGVYYCTLNTPFQSVKDLWDGTYRECVSYQVYTTNYNDYTTNVKESYYTYGDSSSYATLSALTNSQYQIFGFTERISGISLHFIGGAVNTTAATTASVSYWNGSAWASVGTINDGTSLGGISFNQSGSITWNPISETVDFQQAINGDIPFYFYKIQLDKTLSASVLAYNVKGISSPVSIKNYKIPILWQNRLWLLNNQSGNKNSGRCSSTNTISVWNGTDTKELLFGDDTEITAGASLFSRFGGSIYEQLIVTKQNATFIVDGISPNTYTPYQISSTYGCIAPETLKICNLGYELSPGINKHIAIWQSATAIVIFDGNSVIPVSGDISNYFDPLYSECINPDMASKSIAWIDETYGEYHWKFASGTSTTLDTELVYDLIKRKWYLVNRGSGKSLQYGFPVVDTSGNKYTYGTTDSGYMYHLENGTTFDVTSIISRFKTYDITLGGWMRSTLIRKIKLLFKAKSTTTNSISVTHYQDTVNTATDAAITFTAKNTTKRVLQPIQSVGWTDGVFHSLDCQITTSDENIGFEPIGISLLWEFLRDDIS